MKKRALASLLIIAMLLGLSPGALAVDEQSGFEVPEGAVAVYDADELRVYLENEEAETLYIMSDMELDLFVEDEETGEISDGMLESGDSIFLGFTGREDCCVYTLNVTGGTLSVPFAQVAVREAEELAAYEAGESPVAVPVTEDGVLHMEYVLDASLDVSGDMAVSKGYLGVTDAGFLNFEEDSTLTTRGVFRVAPDPEQENTKPKFNAVAFAQAEVSTVFYANMAVMEEKIGALVDENDGMPLERIVLCGTEGNSSYAKLNFDIPDTLLLQAFLPLEIGADVTVAAESLWVSGDCIWYPTSVILASDINIEGNFPTLIACSVEWDEDGRLVEQQDYHGMKRLRQPDEEVIEAFYALYYDGGHWVTEPVAADQLQADGELCWQDRSGDARNSGVTNFVGYAMGRWNEFDNFYAEGVGGFDFLTYYVDCYLGTVNFFSEPRYDEDSYLPQMAVSPLSGGTVYVASYLPMEDLDLYWSLRDHEGNLLNDPFRELSIQMLEEESGEYQTVFEVRVPAETIRDYPEGVSLNVRGYAYHAEDDSEEELNIELFLYPPHVLGWTQEEMDRYELTASEFGLLEESIMVGLGESVTGYIYMAYYDSESGVWRADRYANDGENAWLHPEGGIAVTGNEDGSTTVFADASDDEADWIYWTNGYMDEEGIWRPNMEIDESTLPVRVKIMGGGGSAAFFEDNSFESVQIGSMSRSPLMDTVFYLGLLSAEDVVLENMYVSGPDELNYSVTDDERMYRFCLPAAAGRNYGYDEMQVTVVLTLSDGEKRWDEIYTLNIYGDNTIGWLECETVEENPELASLTDVVTMKIGEKATGVLFFVYFEDGAWHADPYPYDYWWKEQEGPFAIEDAGDGLVSLNCQGIGMEGLWWTNFNEDGTSPNDDPDQGCSFPLRLVSEEPYLTFNWVSDYGYGFTEENNYEMGYRITPVDRFAHAYYLNWFDPELPGWNRIPVTPELVVDEDAGVSENSVSIDKIDPEEIAWGEDNADNFVFISADDSLWDKGFTLQATVGEGENAITGRIYVDVRRHRGGFYSRPEMSNDAFVTGEWTVDSSLPAAAPLYFGAETYENEGYPIEIYAVNNQDEDGRVLYSVVAVPERDDMVEILVNTADFPSDWLEVEIEVLMADQRDIPDPDQFRGSTWTENYRIRVTADESGFCVKKQGEFVSLGLDRTLMPLADSGFYFRTGAAGQDAVVSFEIEEDPAIESGEDRLIEELEIEEVEDGLYLINIPQSVTRKIAHQGRHLSATIDYGDGVQDSRRIFVHAAHALAWGWGDEEMLKITNDLHGLEHVVCVREGERAVGTAYYVWYNTEDPENPVWQADAYSGGYLLLEEDEEYGRIFEVYPTQENAQHGQTVLECTGQGVNYLYWSQHELDDQGNVTGPSGMKEPTSMELVLVSEEPYSGRLYAGPEFHDEIVSEAIVSPLSGGMIYLGVPDGEAAVKDVVFSDLRITGQPLDNGMYEIRIPTEFVLFDCAPNGEFVANITFEDGENNVWKETMPIRVNGMNAMAWDNQKRKAHIALMDTDHGLTDRVILGKDDVLEGAVYFVYYSDVEGKWAADCYGGEYLRYESFGAAMFESIPDDENDDYSYDDATRITCVGGGEDYLWWTNHAVDENGDVTGPRDETDYDCWPLVFSSTQPYLSLNWAVQDGEGNWYEEHVHRRHGCFNTPNHGWHDHIFYLNWADEEGNWQIRQVTPVLEDVLDEEGNSILQNDPVSVESMTAVSGLENHVRITVSEWDRKFILSAQVEEDGKTLRAEQDFWVYLPAEAFYAQPEMTKENSIFDFTPVWGEENVFWFGYTEPEDSIESWEVQCDGVRVEEVESTERRLLKITVDEVTEYPRDLVLEIWTAEGRYCNMEIRIHGVENQDDFLGHRGLRNPDGVWQVDWEQELSREIGSLTPGEERWLVFYYVPYGGQPQPVEVEVTEGGELVSLEKVADLEIGSIHPDCEDYANCFYRLKVKEGGWGETVTLTAYVDEESVVSDTFVIDRGHAAFFSVADTDLENYISSFTLKPDGPTELYMHLQPPEDWTISEIITDWYNEEREEYELLPGLDTLTALDEMDDNMFRLVIDPTLVRRNYWNEDYHLELQIRYRDPEGREHDWGVGLPVINRLPYLTYANVDWNGREYFLRDERDSYLLINPQQDRFMVFFLNVYHETEDRWEEIPIHPEIAYVSDGGEEDFVTLRHYWETGENQPAEEWVMDYGVRMQVDPDSWDMPFAVQGWGEGYYGHLRASVGRGEISFYNSPNLNNDTFIEFFRLSDLTDGNVLYVGGEFGEDEGRWIKDVTTDGWVEGDGEQRECENGDLVSITRTTSKAYRLVIDRKAAQERFGRDGFHLQVNVQMEDVHGNVWSNPVGIWVENNLPFLSFKWLENNENGWYAPAERGLDDQFSTTPGNENFHVYGLGYYDRNGNLYIEGVVPTSSDSSVIKVEKVTDLGHYIALDQANGDKFVRLTAGDNAWDKTVTLTGTVGGRTASMQVFVGRGEAEFHNSTTISNETYIREFGKDPFNPENNVFYLAIRKDHDWNVELGDVSLRDYSEETAVLEKLGMDESENYYLVKVTLAESAAATDNHFELVVEYRWVEQGDATGVHDREAHIWVASGGGENHAASIRLGDREVMFYRTEEGIAVPYSWEYDETLDCGVLVKAEDLGMTYDADTNTLTLNDANLNNLVVSTDLEPGTKISDLTIELVGENIISGGQREAAMYVEGGLNVTITAEEQATLVLEAHNDDADPWSHAALELGDNRGGDLTITGQAEVKFIVDGEVFETDEDGNIIEDEAGNPIPGHLCAVGMGRDNDAVVTIMDNAILTVVGPENLLAHWSGLSDIRNLVVRDSATLNTQQLVLYQEGAELQILGGTVNVGMRGYDNPEDYYFNGFGVENGNLIMEGGVVNISAPIFKAEEKRLYTNAITVNAGSFTLSGGRVNVDMTGFTSDNPEYVGGVAVRVGDNEREEAASFTQSGGSIHVEGGTGHLAGMEIGANATADLNAGTITSCAWQGVVNNGIINVRSGMEITLAPWTDSEGVVYSTSEGGVFRNDLHYVVRRVSALNMYGGKLTINALEGHAMVSQSEYLQTAGMVTLKTESAENILPAAYFGGRTSITGGTMNVNGPEGILLIPEDYMNQNYFRLAGGSVNIDCVYNGMTSLMPTSLQGGSLKIRQSDGSGDRLVSAVLVCDGGTLAVTGGEHEFFGFVKNGEGKSVGLQTYNSGTVKFTGGTTDIRGNFAALVSDTAGYSNVVQVGSGMYLASNTGSAAPYFYEDESWQDSDGVNTWDVYSLILMEQVDGEAVLSTDVTVAPGEAPAIETTAQVEVTTARPAVGALVTVQTTVTADNGKASFALENLELAGDEITVNGVVYSGGLTDIPVEGSALIVFRVKPVEEGNATVSCVVENAAGDKAEDSASFSVFGFRMSAPTYTTMPRITVRGTAAPGEVIRLTVTNGEAVEVTVTELGTFAVSLELPVREENYDAQSFSIVAEMNGNQVGETLSVVYNPTSVRLDYLRITNEIVDSMGNPIKSTNEVSYLSGTGMPERSFYTYIPGMNRFEFETEFYVPTGWIITSAKVVVSYQQDGIGEEFTDLPLTEDTACQRLAGDGMSRTEIWVWDAENKELPAAPIDFKVVYRVARVKDTVIPDPDPVLPEDEEEELEDYVEEKEERITDVVPLIPIIDPSGIIYSGSLDNPISGATVTLYYGGSGEEPGQAELADMSSYSQSNPQISDETGHYGWDVPTGWWKIVAEKNGFRAESQWVHVLPAHTDLHLNLNMPSDSTTSYDLSAIRPLTTNGKIPGGDFSAEVTVTNFTGKTSAVLIVAAYEEDGRFISVQHVPVSGLDRGVTTSLSVEISNSNGKAHSMKAFLVESMEKLTPQSGTVEFRGQS